MSAFNVALEIQRLSENFGESLRMMADIQKLREELPGIDCGACGAPTCRAFAEDVVKGTANIKDCTIMYRSELLQYLDSKGDESDS